MWALHLKMNASLQSIVERGSFKSTKLLEKSGIHLQSEV